MMRRLWWLPVLAGVALAVGWGAAQTTEKPGTIPGGPHAVKPPRKVSGPKLSYAKGKLTVEGLDADAAYMVMALPRATKEPRGPGKHKITGWFVTNANGKAQLSVGDVKMSRYVLVELDHLVALDDGEGEEDVPCKDWQSMCPAPPPPCPGGQDDVGPLCENPRVDTFRFDVEWTGEGGDINPLWGLRRGDMSPDVSGRR